MKIKKGKKVLVHGRYKGIAILQVTDVDGDWWLVRYRIPGKKRKSDVLKLEQFKACELDKPERPAGYRQ